ncbi:hypothetical protein QC761_506050 [Podospora bellae-mahoneyi]|uniref:Integral membrane protein n=1 Tax=Podospora bellae-mahoneyi TaxID=2093777 RepID=A0ABR0FGZ8_9PEZI|nr:hypothetical protein QC761_506050 [Podospora bellae-mahoneyi]
MMAHLRSPGILMPALAGWVIPSLARGALAHGGHGGMEMTEADKPLPEDQYPLTYFAHPDHKAAIYGHIVLMVLGWMFVLPAAVMLSLARSRYTLYAQFSFLALNTSGMLLGIVYNASTPDLYPNNAHHKIGWIVTIAAVSQVAIGLLARVAGMMKRGELGSVGERQGFIPVSTEAIQAHESGFPGLYRRFSHDSGQGTELGSETLRSHSISSPPTSLTIPSHLAHKEYQYDDGFEDEDLEHNVPSLKKTGKALSMVAKVAGKISDRFWKILMFAYNFVDRTILLLSFISLCTGVITYARFFEGNGIFSGLAHWIKGGVFVWLGWWTLARWAGSFGDLGWAWNVRPKKAGQKWCPSAEFVESALIFFYGSTNVFLEHLGNWGGEWSSQDLEHVSITVLFIGGGLCGMLIESIRIRNLLNFHVVETAQEDHIDRDQLREPETYAFSLNPIPALVIILTGLMMSSHTQESMISTMVHKQWGDLITAASLSRGLSYVVMYLKPPKTIYPSRPPTELLTAFGLTAGGFMFMASSSDTVDGMIHYQLNPMFMYTVSMGFVALMMAWVILLVALKGWAEKREAAGRLTGKAFP